MKKKSNKLAKLEKSRYSILTDNMDICWICHRPASDIHEIYGGGNRQVSMQNGFCIPLCREHHQRVHINSNTSNLLKSHCQLVFEKNHTREEFMKLIGRNYL